MHLDAPAYQSELTALRGTHVLDWPSPSPGLYERKVGKLTLRVETVSTNLTKWSMVHDRAGLLSQGSSESYTVAMLEMLTYAEHWVRTAMVGLMA